MWIVVSEQLTYDRKLTALYVLFCALAVVPWHIVMVTFFDGDWFSHNSDLFAYHLSAILAPCVGYAILAKQAWSASGLAKLMWSVGLISCIFYGMGFMVLFPLSEDMLAAFFQMFSLLVLIYHMGIMCRLLAVVLVIVLIAHMRQAKGRKQSEAI